MTILVVLSIFALAVYITTLLILLELKGISKVIHRLPEVIHNDQIPPEIRVKKKVSQPNLATKLWMAEQRNKMKDKEMWKSRKPDSPTK